MSTTKEPRIPGPDHPITVEPFSGRVTVTSGGRKIADTTAALELREASYPPVYYVPLADVDAATLRGTDTTTYCPYKGEAGYYSVTTAAGDTVDDVIWFYEQPYPAVAAIAGHVAFYPDKAEISVEPD